MSRRELQRSKYCRKGDARGIKQAGAVTFAFPVPQPRAAPGCVVSASKEPSLSKTRRERAEVGSEGISNARSALNRCRRRPRAGAEPQSERRRLLR